MEKIPKYSDRIKVMEKLFYLLLFLNVVLGVQVVVTRIIQVFI